MQIDLSPELEALVQSNLDSGRYQSASDVLSDALRLLDQRDEILLKRTDHLRQAIEEGWTDATNGNLVDGDEVFDRIDRELSVLERTSR